MKTKDGGGSGPPPQKVTSAKVVTAELRSPSVALLRADELKEAEYKQTPTEQQFHPRTTSHVYLVSRVSGNARQQVLSDSRRGFIVISWGRDLGLYRI